MFTTGHHWRFLSWTSICVMCVCVCLCLCCERVRYVCVASYPVLSLGLEENWGHSCEVTVFLGKQRRCTGLDLTPAPALLP